MKDGSFGTSHYTMPSSLWHPLLHGEEGYQVACIGACLQCRSVISRRLLGRRPSLWTQPSAKPCDTNSCSLHNLLHLQGSRLQHGRHTSATAVLRTAEEEALVHEAHPVDPAAVQPAASPCAL